MKIKLLCMVLFTAALLQQTHAQTAAKAGNANDAEHVKFDALYHSSVNVVLPDSVFSALKNYAFAKGYSEAEVMKNQYCLAIMYNNGLSTADRIFACEMLIEMYKAPESRIPLYLITDMKNNLTKKK